MLLLAVRRKPTAGIPHRYRRKHRQRRRCFIAIERRERHR